MSRANLRQSKYILEKLISILLVHLQKALRSSCLCIKSRPVYNTSQPQSVIHLLPAPFTDVWVGADTQTFSQTHKLYPCVFEFWDEVALPLLFIIFGLISFPVYLFACWGQEPVVFNHFKTTLELTQWSHINITNTAICSLSSKSRSPPFLPFLSLTYSLSLALTRCLSYQCWWL